MTEDVDLKIGILSLASRVMDAIEERKHTEADLIARYQDAVRKTADTVDVGGESVAIERDSEAIEDRVEMAGRFLRMVQRTDRDYEATVNQALAQFAGLMER